MVRWALSTKADVFFLRLLCQFSRFSFVPSQLAFFSS